MRILLLEDEALQRELVVAWLTSAGHAVVDCSDGAAAITAIERDSFDLAVLDWEVPQVSGEEVLRWIRKRRPAMLVLFATSRDAEDAIVHILGLGADDYLVKPLRRAEFVARVAALGRRAASAASALPVVQAGPYRVDLKTHQIHLNGEPVKMAPRAAHVAALLFRKLGELVSRREIYEEVWGHREQIETRSVDTHVSRLRKVLELDGTHGFKLTSVYQLGYRLEEV